MTTRQRNATILALIVLAAAGLAVFSGGGGTGGGSGGGRASVLDAVPDDSFLVATLSVPELRASPIAAPLIKLASSLGGMGNAEKECGFDPFARVDEMAVAVPEETTGELGVIVAGKLDPTELITCAKKVIAARGGSATVAPSPEHPTFMLIEEASALEGKPSLALGTKGLLLVGKGAWLAKMMETAEGKRPSLKKNERHMALRSGAGEGRSIVLTVLLPAALRNRLRGEMVEELDGGESANPSMAGVLGVNSAAVALAAGAPGGTTELLAELQCDSPEACVQVRALIERKRAGWSKDMSFRFIGLGPLFDALTVSAEGSKVTASTRMPADDARLLVERLLDLRRGRTPTSPAPIPPTSEPLAPRGPASAPTRADEVISAKKEAGAGRR
ncbi:MAG: hypothetical protein JWM74_1613 [Myxococcaceae bacterium]|nr:hypothetical protein [Myxococcaceae bacterium]